MKSEFKIDNQNIIHYDDTTWHLKNNNEVVDNCCNYLFKYFSISPYSLDALENSYFFLNNPLNFNDPFDCCNNLVIEQQRDLIDGLAVPFINDLPDIGVTCFSTQELNPLMWGHYTNSYVGFVLKLKADFKFIDNIDIHSHKLIKVVYSDNPKPVPENLPFAPEYKFMIKLKDWEYENEWRLIVKKKDQDLNKVFYSPEIIDEILIGYKSSWPFRNSTDELLCTRFNKLIQTKFKNVKTFSVGPDHKHFKLNKTKLLINPPFTLTGISLK